VLVMSPLVTIVRLYEDFSIVTILAKGNTFNYVIPSFPVFNADIVELKLQREEICRDGSTKLHVFNGFARDSKDLDHPLPGMVCIEFSYNCAFMIEVSTVLYFHTLNYK